MLKLDFKENMDSIEKLKVIILQSAERVSLRPLNHFGNTKHGLLQSVCGGEVGGGNAWETLKISFLRPVFEKAPCH